MFPESFEKKIHYLKLVSVVEEVIDDIEAELSIIRINFCIISVYRPKFG